MATRRAERTELNSFIRVGYTGRSNELAMRLSFPIITTVAITMWMPTDVRAGEQAFAVVGYLPEYRVDGCTPEQVARITDLIYFGIDPSRDGQVSANPVKASVLKKLKELQSVAECRLLICVGGWGRSSGFSALANNEAARNRFIATMLKYCHSNGFDGIDYDWEHPQNAKELADYGELLSDTRTVFRKSGLLVTVAQAGWQNLGKRSYDAVNRVHLMSYDHEFPQATFSKSEADVDRLIDWGCPAEKIALGLPFYGRNKQRETRTYAELVGDRVTATGDTIDGFALNGKRTITRKVNLAMKRNLSGVMIWELGQDTTRKESSLLTTINRHIQLRNPRLDR